jgi:hypothetical protein
LRDGFGRGVGAHGVVSMTTSASRGALASATACRERAPERGLEIVLREIAVSR